MPLNKVSNVMQNQHLLICFSDVFDGPYVKNHPMYIKHNGQILCIQVYMDEVEVANPLGSKKGKHKVCVFYWVLLNIPPIFRSSLKSIQLLGIVSCDLIKERGVEIFLKKSYTNKRIGSKRWSLKFVRMRWLVHEVTCLLVPEKGSKKGSFPWGGL
jgi:hypothetical protein